MAFDAFLRSRILSAAGRPGVRSWFERNGDRLGVSRFVAGPNLEAAVAPVQALNSRKLAATLDLLGEHVYETEQAQTAASRIAAALQAICELRLDSHVSVKLTQLGLCMDFGYCLELMRGLCREAQSRGLFIRIDMEDSGITELTVRLFRRLLEEFGPRTIGLVLQSCLYRSLADVRDLGRLGANLRIVKGAYRMTSDVAYTRRKDIESNYIRLARLHMESGSYTAIATHDRGMIDPLRRYADEAGISRDRFEFQLLYGVASRLQQELVDDGYRVRIYTPFGDCWYPYFTRRIAERPANLMLALKAILGK
ncbi:proline dehydrogenase family protein [Paenibacillus athensensis]|uniref:proline dehydrogenase n=1 Tax=Paenibacillus athensensis TaxID=1967502 RepID=A0A4Y8QBB3_9BACL|nr:proline dehydrogenase family protein [Paenibacillus athensensis]MCD1257544.1 proline dehydrogenase family protein [Paenibacillus athensensis]